MPVSPELEDRILSLLVALDDARESPEDGRCSLCSSCGMSWPHEEDCEFARVVRDLRMVRHDDVERARKDAELSLEDK